MRLGRLVVTALAAGMLTGCGGTPATEPSVAPEAAANGEPYVIVEPGRRTPSAGPQKGGSAKPGLPPVSFLPTSPAGCTVPWPEDGLVLIPMVVTPISGGFRVQWPASYGPTYRLTAVHQGLVTGAQPEPTWQTVAAGANCTVTATISGLTSGDPYLVWLDAPNTPVRADGSRSLRSGKTAVVHPL